MFHKSEEKRPQTGHLVRGAEASRPADRSIDRSEGKSDRRRTLIGCIVTPLRDQLPALVIGGFALATAAGFGILPSYAVAGEPTPANVSTAPMVEESVPHESGLKSVRVGMVPERLPGQTMPARMRQQPIEEVPASPVVRGLTIDGVEVGVRPLMSSRIDIAPKAEGENRQLPEDYSKPIFASQPQLHDIPSPYHQRYTALASATASDFCYRPLYFEEVNLERYGRTHGLIQPVLSGARFVATVPALPYLMGTYHPTECYYWSHPYEAGRYAPRERELPPLNLEGGIAEATVLTGLIFLFP